MRHTYFPIFLIPAMLMTGCHDDSSKPAVPIKDKTFTKASGLQLFYNGMEMPNKSVSFSQNGNKADVKMFSSFNLSELNMGLSGTVPAAGVIPGTPEVDLNVELEENDGYWIFNGNSSTDYCDYSYSGYVSPESMKLFLDNVKLKSGGVNPAIWQPAPVKKGEGLTYESIPFYIDWDYEPIPNVDIDLSPVIKAIATLPVIPVYNNTAYMSVSEALSLILKTVAFRDDGNLIFSYISTSFGADQLAQTEPNRFQYVISGPSEVKLFVDPMSLIGLILVNTSGSTPPSQVDLTATGLYPAGTQAPSTDDRKEVSELGKELMVSAMTYFLPRMAQGIPMKFKADSGSLELYIDTPMLLELFKEIVLPVIQKQKYVEELEKWIAGDPSLSSLIPDLKKAVQLLPEAFERTNTLRLGFNFVPYTAP